MEIACKSMIKVVFSLFVISQLCKKCIKYIVITYNDYYLCMEVVWMTWLCFSILPLLRLAFVPHLYTLRIIKITKPCLQVKVSEKEKKTYSRSIWWT